MKAPEAGSTMNIRHLRDANVKTTQMMIGMGIRVTQQGSDAYVVTDPSTYEPIRINLPFLPDDAPVALIKATQGYMDHEAAHILFTDWLVRAEAEREGLAASHNIVEDCYVERAMTAHFLGSATNLEELHKLFTTEITPGLLDRSDGSELRAFEVLVVPAARALAGQDRFVAFMNDGKHWDRPAMQAFLHAFGASARARMPNLHSSAECLEVARLFGAAARKAREVAAVVDGKAASHFNQSETRKTRAGKDEASEKSTVGAQPRPTPSVPDRNLEAGTQDPGCEVEGATGNDDVQGPGQADAPVRGDETSGDPEMGAEPGPRSAADRDEEVGKRNQANGDQAVGDDGGTPGSASSNRALEQTTSNADPFSTAAAAAISAQAEAAISGAQYRVYTRDHDRIEVLQVDDAFDDDLLGRLDDAVAEQVGALQRNFERTMAARRGAFMVPGFTSGRLHAGALHRLTTGDARVFRRKQVVPSMNTALSLLIDNSGSMRGEKMLLAMMAGYALAHSAERVGIACECLGFTTHFEPGPEAPSTLASDGVNYSRWQPLYVPIYKQFDERMRPAVRRRFAAAAMGQAFCYSNVDGECVAIASTRLLTRREVRKVLIVLSDGHPAGGRDEDLRQHLHTTITAVTKAGIELIGIGIGDDAVTSFYPRSFVLDNIAQLPEALLGELRGAIIGARPESARSRKAPSSNKSRKHSDGA